MLFALIHELAHMITGIIVGLKPKTLQIMPFGLSIIFETYESQQTIRAKKILIAMAGPIINIIVAVILWFVNKEWITIIYSNILIAFFNLLPIYPLDGGQIIKLCLNIKYDHNETEIIMNKISNISIVMITALSSIAILMWKNIGLIFVIIYLWMVMIKENRKMQLYKKVHNIIAKEEKRIYTNK